MVGIWIEIEIETEIEIVLVLVGVWLMLSSASWFVVDVKTFSSSTEKGLDFIDSSTCVRERRGL